MMKSTSWAFVAVAFLLQQHAAPSTAFVVLVKKVRPSTTTTTTITSPTTVRRFAVTTTTPPDSPQDDDEQPPAVVVEVKTSPKPRPGIDSSTLGDLSGGRPGAIIESEEELARKQEIFDEIQRKERTYPDRMMEDYGTLDEELEAEYDTDDPTAIDSGTLGTWTIKDLQSKFPYEWDPDDGDLDPNLVELNQPGVKNKAGVDVDDDGIDVGYNPMYGQSSPQDERTILGAMESFMINEQTKDDSMIPSTFPDGDLEIEYNEEIVQFRKSLDIIETYTDPFLPEHMQVPRHVAKWHGYPEPMSFPHKNITNNRFLDDDDGVTPKTDWSKLDAYGARRKAVELARAQNADWLPPGKSYDFHMAQREPYERIGTVVGSLRPGKIDEALKQSIQPALDILGSAAILLSIEGEDQTVFRFEYHGLMKHRHGMSAWTETLIRDCGVEVTGVIFEAGFRKRDQPYEGGDCWYPPSSSVVTSD